MLRGGSSRLNPTRKHNFFNSMIRVVTTKQDKLTKSHNTKKYI